MVGLCRQSSNLTGWRGVVLITLHARSRPDSGAVLHDTDTDTHYA